MIEFDNRCVKPDNFNITTNSPNEKKYNLNLSKLITKSILKPCGPLCRKCGRYVGGEIVTVIKGQHYCVNCFE